jgi:hypothetical protein
MVDRLHIPIWNRTKKPLAIVLSDGGKVNNAQCKSNQNCHYESPLYNILIKTY